MEQRELQRPDNLLTWRFHRLRADRLISSSFLPVTGNQPEVVYHGNDRLPVTVSGLRSHPDFRRALEEGTGTTVCRIWLAGTITQDRCGALAASEQTIVWIAGKERPQGVRD
jgi:hypothetical protein